MNVIFHEKYYHTYESDPAAAPGRMEPIIRELKQHPDYRFITPAPATSTDILQAHSRRHIDYIKQDPIVYEMALLAAGGAIKAAELACAGEPSFACIRPPGHHASFDSAWGFCFFNNMAVSLLKLKMEGRITSAFILDFDLHTGDGNINILLKHDGLTILNPRSHTEEDYLKEVEAELAKAGDFDIVAASAGFDEYVKDWGQKLSTNAYRTIGALLKDFSEKHCRGRRYALLEGGYYHQDLGINVHAFCEGFR
ncbi:MAG TPA: histone deacetylase family protein [Thermodesulfobacteriota bacterium]|nr:histone deacetylase family protein [Deltaproteobacteria bacterium]HNR12554.1 histone deacetylase family protein [Thermodesulfobacteriota bacterium]HNU71711.1 histone deacetylase family protein [Thermodesulfobacteriota bacterium]